MTKRGLFINSERAVCSIYESGLMVYNAIKPLNDEYVLHYIENIKDLTFFGYDFVIINWHPLVLNISKSFTDLLHGIKIAMVVEVGQINTDYIPVTPNWFDAYMIIDPTKIETDRFFIFPRPLEIAENIKPLLSKDKLVLGGFGFFAWRFREEKRFEELVINANNMDTECIVRVNLPVATFMCTSINQLHMYGKELLELAKSNVEVIVTYKFMEKQELISWCSENTVNVFPYYRSRAGLSAVTDQAISSGRPLIVNECNTFRHLHEYIDHYPNKSYTELINSTADGVRQLQTDWHPDIFREKTRSMFKRLGIL